MSRAQVVELALARNQTLQAARTVIEQVEARREAAGLRSNPELSFSYSTDWLFNDEGESSMAIGFAQKFPVTKRLSILRDIAEVEIALAKAEVRNQERELVREVELLCNEIAYTNAELELRHSLMDIDKEFAAFVDSRIKKAEASPIDANQVRIELYILEQEIERLEIDRARLLERLRAVVGIEVGDPFSLSHALEPRANAPVLSEFSRDELDTHPEYQLRKLMLEVAGKQESLALASRWDDIALGVMFEQERSIDEPYGIGNDRFVGLSVSVPLPLKKRTSSLVRERVLARRQMEQLLDASSLELRSKANALKQEAVHLYQQSRDYEERITALVEQNLKEMGEAFSAGQVSLNELFRSQGQQLKIQSAYLELVRDYEQALVEWKAAVAKNI